MYFYRSISIRGEAVSVSMILKRLMEVVEDFTVFNNTPLRPEYYGFKR